MWVTKLGDFRVRTSLALFRALVKFLKGRGVRVIYNLYIRQLV